MCAMLKRRGHTVIHNGHEDSQVEGEHVTVTTNGDLEVSYPGWDWRSKGFPPFQVNDFVYGRFYNHAVRAIGARKQPETSCCACSARITRQLRTRIPT